MDCILLYMICFGDEFGYEGMGLDWGWVLSIGYVGMLDTLDTLGE